MLQDHPWMKHRHINHSTEVSNNQITCILGFIRSYAIFRISRTVVTTFSVIILMIYFYQDEESGGTCQIDYLLTTFLYFFISEFEFSKSEDHVTIRYALSKYLIDC